jgi:aryl-alcohol dehydrogenase-like predicted oxidoreductase
VPFELGVSAAREVAALAPAGVTTAQLALRWIVDQPGVSVVIPGARTAAQARANAEAAAVPPLDAATLSAFETIYDERIRGHVHDRW